MSQCIHDLELGTCSICSGREKREAVETVDFEFHAKFESQCFSCNLPINIGQLCVKTTKGRTLHRWCFDG